LQSARGVMQVHDDDDDDDDVRWLITATAVLDRSNSGYSPCDYKASNEMVIRTGKHVKVSGRGLILRHYSGIRLEGLRKKSGQPDSGTSSEPETSRIRRRSSNHSTLTFGQVIVFLLS
jgi:hypothetical protein